MGFTKQGLWLWERGGGSGQLGGQGGHLVRRGTVCTWHSASCHSSKIQPACLRTPGGESPGEMHACGISRVENPTPASGRELAAHA